MPGNALALAFLLLAGRGSALEIEDLSLSGTNLTIECPARPTDYYVVRSSASLEKPTWVPVSVAEGTNRQISTFQNVQPISFLALEAVVRTNALDLDDDGYSDVEELTQGTDPLCYSNQARRLIEHPYDDLYQDGACLVTSNGTKYVVYTEINLPSIGYGKGYGKDGSGGLRYVLAANTSAYSVVWVSQQVWGTELPQPGRSYRLSFDGRAEQAHHFFNFYWYNGNYYSGRTSPSGSLTAEHLYFYEPVTFSREWQHYERDFYFQRDPRFSSWGHPASPVFTMRFEPCVEGTLYIDNLTLEEIYPPRPKAPRLANRGFERGFYGWSDTCFWVLHGLAPATETNRAHWAVAEDAAHSGRRSIQLVRQGTEGARFLPSLQGAIEKLEPGANYLITFWIRTIGDIGSLSVTIQDNTWGGYLLQGAAGSSAVWKRMAYLMYRYGDTKTYGLPGLVNGGPQTERAAMISITPQVVPWPTTLYIDDFQMDVVNDALADAITNAVAHGVDPCTLPGFPAGDNAIEELDEPFLLRTDFDEISQQQPFAPGYRLLDPTNSLSLPFVVERNTNIAWSSDDVELAFSISDFQSNVLWSATQTVTLVSNAYTGALAVTEAPFSGRLPEGVFAYAVEAVLSNDARCVAARDRFTVCAYTNAIPADPTNCFLGVDEDLLTAFAQDWYSGQVYPVLESMDFEFENHLPIYRQIGAKTVRLWLYGENPNEIARLTAAVARVRSAGMEPLVCINGYVGALTNQCYSLGSAANYDARWNQAQWETYIRNLARLFTNELSVRHWEILNEPSSYNNRVEAYTNILGSSYRVLKSENANLVVHGFTQILDFGTLAMIEACAKRGALSNVDCIDYHAYSDVTCVDFPYIEKLKGIVRKYADLNPAPFGEGEVYLPTSIPIWMTEYTPDQPLISSENRILNEERARAAALMQKLLTAKAYNLNHFILYGVAQHHGMGFSAKPVHRPAASCIPNLNYAAARTFARHLNFSRVEGVCHTDRLRAFLFKTHEGREAAGAWTAAQTDAKTVGPLPSALTQVRLDGSAQLLDEGALLTLTEEPVLLLPVNPDAPYSWETLFGADSTAIVYP
ncbi:MAG TPA: hypothetical protein DCZ95_15470 [Verrucomicrobia bacterium]|nr:MAG: hypothetical protein A2X46_02765 [Lentisphaerae bacterium GWF2_57_35]HBA85485.1 hypothetical protein [Verrucomicrobiota bacterium]